MNNATTTPLSFFDAEEQNPRRIVLNIFKEIPDIHEKIAHLQVFIADEIKYLSQLQPPEQHSAELDDAQRWLKNLENYVLANGAHVIEMGTEVDAETEVAVEMEVEVDLDDINSITSLSPFEPTTLGFS